MMPDELPHPGQASPPGLRAGDGVALAALFVGAFAAIGIPLALVRWLTGWEPGSAGAVVAAEVVAAGVTIRCGLRWSGLPFHVACPIGPYPLRIVPGVLLGSFGATILLAELERWMPGYQRFQRLIMLQFGQSRLLAVFVAVCVAAPILEELVCRGVLLSGLRRRHSARAALWLSAFLFALLHLNPWQAVGALPLGLAFGWLVLRTGSLIPAILGHATANFSGSFLLGTLLSVLRYPLPQIRGTRHIPLPVLAVAAAALAAGALVVWWPLRRYAPAPAEPAPPPPPPGLPAPSEGISPGGGGEPAERLSPTEGVRPGGLGEPAERLSPRALPSVVPRLVATTLAAAALVVATPLARRYVARRPSPVDTRAAGCYLLSLPAGTSARLFPGAAAAPLPVRLSRLPYRKAWEDRRKFLVQRLDGVAALDGSAPGSTPVYWFGSGGDVRIVAQQGRGLTLLRLRRQGDDLGGEARHYDGTETEGVAGVGRVIGKRIDCPAPARDRE